MGRPTKPVKVVFDRWVRQWRRRHAHGDMIVVRFTDDFIVGFQYREDAERFLEELRERVAKFGLGLHPEKTRRVESGRFAARNRLRVLVGKGKSPGVKDLRAVVTLRRERDLSVGKGPGSEWA